MSGQWKPGDVALVQVSPEYPPEIAVRGGGTFAEKWYVGGPRLGSQHGWHEHYVTVIRPLVVIDPEDAEAVDNLGRIMAQRGYGDFNRNDLAAALREFANPAPPKCAASLFVTYGDGKGAEQRCDRVEGHEGPHVDGSFTWTAVQP